MIDVTWGPVTDGVSVPLLPPPPHPVDSAAARAISVRYRVEGRGKRAFGFMGQARVEACRRG